MFPPKDGDKELSFKGYTEEEEELARTLRLLADAGIGMPPSLGW